MRGINFSEQVHGGRKSFLDILTGKGFTTLEFRNLENEIPK